MNPSLRRVLLVGFMASGKSSVGRLLAGRLGWLFFDFDDEISARVGLPIPEIFRQHGEDFFRKVENEVGKDLLQKEKVVLASGGGWPAAAGRMDHLGPSTLSVWLKITAEEAVRRAQLAGATRPLLEVPDPIERAGALLEERSFFYSMADLSVDSTRSGPEKLVEEIEAYMNEMGWE